MTHTSVRRFSRDSFLYALGTLAQRGASLVLIPLYTATFLVAEYGAYETLTATVQNLVVFVNFGLSSALIRFYSECKTEAEIEAMVRTASVLVLSFSFGIFLVLLPFYGALGSLFLKDNTARGGILIALAIMWAIGGAFNQQLFSYYRARQAAGRYVLLSLSILVVMLVLNTAFVRFLKMGVLGVLLGGLATTWGINLWLTTKFWHHSHKISREWARKLLGFGLPLVFASFGSLILNSADRYFIAYYRGLHEVGLYGLGYKVGFIIEMGVTTPFQLAWGPFVFAHYATAKEKSDQDFSCLFTYLLLALSMGCLALFLFAPELLAFLGSGKFADARQVVPYVLLAYIFNGIYYWAANLFHLEKKTIWLSAITFGMAVLNLILNWIWIPVWGWRGAALSTLVTIAGNGLVTLLIGQSLHPIQLEVRRLGKLALALVCVCGLYAVLPLSQWGWLVKGGILLSVPLLLLVLGFFGSSEIRFASALPGQVWRRFQLVVRRMHSA